MTRLLRLRARLIPEESQLGWMPIFTLGYLLFLFLPIVFDRTGGQKSVGMASEMLWPTLLSVAVFLPLYFKAYRSSGTTVALCVLGISGLCFVLFPWNTYANTYLIYAAAFIPLMNGELPKKFAWLIAILGVFLIEIIALGAPVFVFALTAIITFAVFFGNHFFVENLHKRAALKLSHDEVRRLAALAERERIGRDLHDLLGHTLSLIALKSELAGKLFDRDAPAARREIDEVTRVARDALSQVRHAVSGIRAAGLAAELASARQLLELDGVTLACMIGDIDLSIEQETVLALVVREALTNVQRHARAGNVEIKLEAANGHACLRISDDGRGGTIVPGNGLCGMRERVEALGGRMQIDSTSGRGTWIDIELPMIALTTSVSATSLAGPLALR